MLRLRCYRAVPSNATKPGRHAQLCLESDTVIVLGADEGQVPFFKGRLRQDADLCRRIAAARADDSCRGGPACGAVCS